jgi:hypothetical protein
MAQLLDLMGYALSTRRSGSPLVETVAALRPLQVVCPSGQHRCSACMSYVQSWVLIQILLRQSEDDGPGAAEQSRSGCSHDYMKVEQDPSKKTDGQAGVCAAHSLLMLRPTRRREWWLFDAPHSICANAVLAAFCAASRLFLPVPTPATCSPRYTATEKFFRCSSPH